MQSISQEHMTRLRVSAVFHRSVEEYCQQLHDLKQSLHSLILNGNISNCTSSGISSATNSYQTSPLQTMSMLEHLSKSMQHHNEQQQVPQRQQLNFEERRLQLQKYLAQREQLLLEVGRMVRLGKLLKTRLKEPFILDIATGKRLVIFFINIL